MSTLDIVDDGGYNIVTVQADTVPAQLKNAAAGSIAVINGNYALAAGLKISDALASEDANALPPRPTPTSLPCAPATRTARRPRPCSKPSRPTL